MRNFEFEEGNNKSYYSLHGFHDDDDDDDENIDPDKDFSYIDKKIESVLGQYQKDFMGGCSAETLGARLGGYGTFLSDEELLSPCWTSERAFNLVDSNPPNNMHSQHLHQKPAAVTNHSLQPSCGTAFCDGPNEPFNKESKAEPHSSGKCTTNVEKNKTVPDSDKKLLKIRVKMTSGNVLCRDNSSIYSGLGLDLSPCSSPEENPSDNEWTSPTVQASNDNSPSYIIKMMTSPFLNELLVSPLDNALVCLLEKENNLESMLVGSTLPIPVDRFRERIYLEERREGSEGKDMKLKSASKDRKVMHEEPYKQNSLGRTDISFKSAKSVNDDLHSNVINSFVVKRENSGTVMAEEFVARTSTSGPDPCSEIREPISLRGKSSRHSVIYDVKSEEGSEEKIVVPPKKVQEVAVESTKGFASAFSPDRGNAAISNGKTKDKNGFSDVRKESTAIKIAEDQCTDKKTVKLPKQQVINKDKVKEEVFDIVRPTGDLKLRVDKALDLVSSQGGIESDKQIDFSKEIKCASAETVNNKKSNLKEISDRHMGSSVPSRKELSTSTVKKKLEDSLFDGTSAPVTSRQSPMSAHCSIENEGSLNRSNPPKNKREGLIIKQKVRKDIGAANNAVSGKRGIELRSTESVSRISERDVHAVKSKLKQKPNIKETRFASTTEAKSEYVPGVNFVINNSLIGSAVPAENDQWVQCEKCEKWRLVPIGKNADFDGKYWDCSMNDWLPGKNNCSVSEEETTNSVNAMNQFQNITSASQILNNQYAYPEGSAPVGALPIYQQLALPRQGTDVTDMPSGSKNKLAKAETEAFRAKNSQQQMVTVKKDERQLDGRRNIKTMKRLSQDADAIKSNGGGKPSKSGKRKVTDVEASGIPKRIKRVRQESLDSPDVIGQLRVEANGDIQNYERGALRIPKDSMDGRTVLKVKDISKNDGRREASGKKRKLKDQQKSIIPTEENTAEYPLISRVHVKNIGVKQNQEKKLKTSVSQAREADLDGGTGGVHRDGFKYGVGGDNNLQKRGRKNGVPQRQLQAARESGICVDGRRSSERVFDFGLSDNGDTSSSSKISIRVKKKSIEVKGSPIGSISSSPMKPSSSGPVKGTDKNRISHKEPEQMVSVSRSISRVEGAQASNAVALLNEESENRKSFLDHSLKKVSSEIRASSSRVEVESQLEEHKDVRYRPDFVRLEEGSTSGHNLVLEKRDARFLNTMHTDETKLERGKAHILQFDSEKKPTSLSQKESEGGSGSAAIRADNVCMTEAHHMQNMSKDSEASSSVKAASFNCAANTALREAKNLKHSANCMKISGSGLESTVAFFQAALKFLYGASLMESGNSENGRCGDMTPPEAYSTAAKLCEQCALEFERCSDMASAALAYKCMEVAYMKVVYSNDVAASRDRLELQKAIRTAPQATVESPSSSASDVDNVNNQAAMDTVRGGLSVMDHRNHIISAGNKPNFVRLLNFTQDINLAMEALRRSQSAFAVANSILAQAGNEKGISCIKTVLDFSFHDVDGLLHLVRLAMEALSS